MTRRIVFIASIAVVFTFAVTALALQPSREDLGGNLTTVRGTGTYFEVEISSADNPPMIWYNWRDAGMYYGESTLEKNSSLIIIRDGFSFSLSPDIKVARKSKLEMDQSKNPLASKYAPLGDIPQIDPVKYVSLLTTLGAVKQGPTMLPGGLKADMYSLEIPPEAKFPWNNFVVWIDSSTQLPVAIEYSEGNAKRKITFKKIETGIRVDSSKFEVPEGYKLITFEWD
jgi:outer membrane lipoprotein-sorting protein